MEFLTNEFTYKSASGLCDIFAQSAAPTDFGAVKGVVQIAHGMAEHIERYDGWNIRMYLYSCSGTVWAHSFHANIPQNTGIS